MISKILTVLFLTFLIVYYSHASEIRYSLPIENSPFLGSESASVNIIEFIDYQ